MSNSTRNIEHNQPRAYSNSFPTYDDEPLGLQDYNLYDTENANTNVSTSNDVSVPNNGTVVGGTVSEVDHSSDEYVALMDDPEFMLEYYRKRSYGFIAFDAVANFLYFVFNPWFVFVGCFNLLFAYMGYDGIKRFDTGHIGAYLLYTAFKLIGMFTLFLYMMLHGKHVFIIDGVYYQNAYICYLVLYGSLFFIYMYAWRCIWKFMHYMLL